MARRVNDAYYSPSVVAHWLMKNTALDIKGTVLEPCAGDHAIARPLKDAYGLKVLTNDIDRRSMYNYNVSEEESWFNLPICDWTITNPPFSLLDDFLPLAFKYSRVGMAIYCRSSVTEPTFKRQGFLSAHQRHLAEVLYCPRLSFTGDGKTDNSSCNWYIWTKQPVEGCRPHWIVK